MYHGAWTSSEQSYIDQEIAMARSGGLNTLRAVNFLDDVANYRDQAVWSNVDYLMCQARALHMFVILDLSTYRNNLIKMSKIPYNARDYVGFLDFVGKRYRNEPALAFYSLAGEPAAPNGSDVPMVSTQALTEFFAQTSAMLHAADRGHHLISSGGLLYLDPGSGIDWESIFSLPCIDLASIHVYSTWDQDNAVPMVSRWAVRHSKPFVIEEFGFDQSAYTDLQRSVRYAGIYTLSLRYNAAGIAFWNLGPGGGGFDASPQTPAVWKTVRQFSRRVVGRPRTTGPSPPKAPPASSRATKHGHDNRNRPYRIEDTFGRANQVGWGTTSGRDGTPRVAWGMDGDGSKEFVTISGQTGSYGYPGSINVVGIASAGSMTHNGGDALVKFAVSVVGHVTPYVVQNACPDKSCYYGARVHTSQNRLELAKRSNNWTAILASVPFLPRAHTFYWMRLHVIAGSSTTLQAKIWADGSLEPTSWLVTATDSSPLAANVIGTGGSWDLAGTGESIQYACYAYAARGLAAPCGQ